MDKHALKVPDTEQERQQLLDELAADRGCLEVISWGRQEVRDRGTSEILRREAESVADHGILSRSSAQASAVNEG